MSAQIDPSISLFPQTPQIPAQVSLMPPTPPGSLFGGNPYMMPPQPTAVPQGVPPPSGDPSATPPDATEKASIWSKFLTHLQSNPDLTQQLLTYAANASRAPRLGESPLSVMAGAANQAYGVGQNMKGLRTQQGMEQKKLDNDTTTAQAAKEKADADVSTAAWQQKADRIKLDLESGKYKSEEEEAQARSVYLRAQAAALGQPTGESGALSQFTQNIADAALATGKFKDKNAAYLWAADNTLHRQGQTQQQWLQTLFTNSIKSEMELNPSEDPTEAANNATKLVGYIKGNKAITASFNDLFAPDPGQLPTPAPAASTAQPAAGTGAPPDVQARFGADAMIPKGSTLGQYDAGQGFQVLGPNGTIIGYYH